MTRTPAQVEAAAVRAMCREFERAARLATILRWRRYVQVEHFTAGDRALLRWHRAVLRSLCRLECDVRASQRRLEREVVRSLRALAREHRARVLAARRAEYAAWDAAMQHERASTCPACDGALHLST
jgi:hypothetical protein